MNRSQRIDSNIDNESTNSDNEIYLNDAIFVSFWRSKNIHITSSYIILNFNFNFQQKKEDALVVHHILFI